MEERRINPRNKTYLGAEIVFNGRYSTFDCLVRNRSLSGATLEMGETLGTPGAFELTLHREGTPRVCRVVWRSRTQLGVAPTDEKPGTIVPIEAARRMRQLSQERDILRRRLADMNEPA
ncbi:hypothetical protein [Hansschlegelia quercus]|nr:hypothetical protein [Hansschlegelia quercus]